MQAQDHGEIGPVLDLDRAGFRRAPEGVREADAGIAEIADDDLRDAARGDQEIEEDVGPGAAEHQVLAALPDDLVTDGKGDALPEAADEHGVAVVQMAPDRVLERTSLVKGPIRSRNVFGVWRSPSNNAADGRAQHRRPAEPSRGACQGRLFGSVPCFKHIRYVDGPGRSRGARWFENVRADLRSLPACSGSQ